MKRLILLVLAGLAAVLAARADIIYVQGDVSGTWAADTVMVTGEVRVPPGQTLVIQPGVKVLFQVYGPLIIDSTACLQAAGTVEDSISFDVFYAGTNWGGIRFLGASNDSYLEYCHITHGYGSTPTPQGGGIYCSFSSPLISHSLIDSCTAYNGGGIGLHYSQAIITNNTISGCVSEYTGGGIRCAYSEPQIEGNSICNNFSQGSGGGIYCYHSPALVLANSIMYNQVHNAGAGIHISNSDGTVIRGNFIGRNSSYTWGGGIHSYGTDALISGNAIFDNYCDQYGGALHIYYLSSAQVFGNIIKGNRCEGYGGGIYAHVSEMNLKDNIILQNQGGAQGGGLCLHNDCDGEVAFNIFANNETAVEGGGIYSASWPTTIMCYGNMIYQNRAQNGGGCYFYNAPDSTYPKFHDNYIISNQAHSMGGGIFFYSSQLSVMYDNTAYANSASMAGGGIFATHSNPTARSMAIWGNSPDQVYQAEPSIIQVAYSSVQSGWPGLGNINIYPAFVDTAHDDYRLLWGSPCIDTGDPNPIYNDPDGTRADMGAFYYDQSTPVRILLTPHEIPYLIPETGGSMDYTIRAFNRDSLAHAARIWCDLTFPDSSIHGPVLGPVRVLLGAGALLERVRTQNIPAAAPMGVYHYNAYAVVGADTSKDSFMWGKLGTGGLGLETGDGGWQNTGEPITDVGGMRSVASANAAPGKFALHPCSPNPFNAVTVVRFDLPDASHVSLKVYDTAGRLVETLVDGWREAGAHEVTFDAGDLPSGMYFCRIQAGDFEATQKLVLLK